MLLTALAMMSTAYKRIPMNPLTSDRSFPQTSNVSLSVSTNESPFIANEGGSFNSSASFSGSMSNFVIGPSLNFFNSW